MNNDTFELFKKMDDLAIGGLDEVTLRILMQFMVELPVCSVGIVNLLSYLAGKDYLLKITGIERD